MEEQVFRNKIHWLSFLFSILVIWVHSFNGELFLGAGESAARVMELEGRLGNGLGQIAVPGFFIVSAYLFYRNFSMDKLYNKWKSRLKTVAVPYLLWNFLYYMGYVAATRRLGQPGSWERSPFPLEQRPCLRLCSIMPIILFFGICTSSFCSLFSRRSSMQS